MKKVFKNTDETIHVFSQRTQNEGQNQSRSIFFKNDILYSYGYHFPIAEFKENKKGEICVLFNDSYYSNTTSKHQSITRQALRQYTIFTYYEERKVLSELSQLKDNLVKARKPEKYVFLANNVFKLYSDYLVFFGLKMPKEIKKAFKVFNSPELLEKAKESAKKVEAKKKAEKERREKKMIEQFLSYETNYCRTDFDVMRIEAEIIRTGQGVQIDKSDALKLYKAILSGVNVIGQRISHYMINTCNEKILKAGCHTFKIEEIHRIGKQLIEDYDEKNDNNNKSRC